MSLLLEFINLYLLVITVSFKKGNKCVIKREECLFSKVRGTKKRFQISGLFVDIKDKNIEYKNIENKNVSKGKSCQ
jgi:hypothetical protein